MPYLCFPTRMAGLGDFGICQKDRMKGHGEKQWPKSRVLVNTGRGLLSEIEL